MKCSACGNTIKKIRIIGALTLTLTVVTMMIMGCATAQRGAISRSYKMIEDGKYESALRRLSAAEKYVEPTPELSAEICFLRARCFEGLNRLDDAVGLYDFILEMYPDTQHAFRAQRRLKTLGM